MPAPTLQVKRGALLNLPGLRAGEPAFTTDSYDFYVGIDSTTNNNKFVGSHRYWTKETASKGSGVNLVESTSGTDFITLAAPASVGAAVTYYFPATQGATSSVLTNDGNGNLSWASGSNNATFTGITTFSDTTDSTTKDNGAVILEGGMGVEKSVNIGGNLQVTGITTLGQVVYAQNGINVSGFSTIYNLQINNNLNVSGVLDVDKHIDVSQGAIIAGIVSFTDTTNSTNYDTGAVRIDGGVGIQQDVNIGGDLHVLGNVTIGASFVSLKGEEVFIENKDIILGFTTITSPNDDTANHAGVAIASTEGTPLVSFSASGINTLPDTYKQMMWFKSGTLGFATDAFGLNYGLAIGTTTMADGVRLAVGSGITMNDTQIYATDFYGSFNGTFVGVATYATYAGYSDVAGIATNATYAATAGIATYAESAGIATHATYADTAGIATYASNAGISTQVKTISASDTNATYYMTFVDSHNGSATAETVYTDYAIYYNPSTNLLSANNLTVTGTFTLGAGVTQISGTVSAASSATTLPTSQAIIDYLAAYDTDDDLSVAGDTGGTLTIDFDTETLTIAGTPNEIETVGAGNSITIGLPDNVQITTSLDVPTVEATNLKAKDGTTAITITDGTGAVGFANSVTISGDLYVLGNTTEVNTTTLKVEDSLIDLGLINSGGSLVQPTSDLNIDVGVLFNWYSGSAKKAAMFWDDSAGRIVFGDDVSESSSVLTVNTYSPIEIKELWMNDTEGQSVVASYLSVGALYTGSAAGRYLQNITVDAGTF